MKLWMQLHIHVLIPVKGAPCHKERMYEEPHVIMNGLFCEVLLYTVSCEISCSAIMLDSPVYWVRHKKMLVPEVAA